MNTRKSVTLKALSLVIATMLVVPASLLVVSYQTALAAGSGLRNPTADAADVGDGFELDPTSAYANGGGFASNVDGRNQSHRFYNFGLPTVLPPDAIINGIEVRLDAWASSTISASSLTAELSWDGGTSWTTIRSTPSLGTSETTYLLGGATDVWDEAAWSLDDLSDANFRVRIGALAPDSAFRDFFLDYVAVTIYYTAADVKGLIWSDNDGNGAQNGEPVLSNIAVALYRDDGDSIFEGNADDVLVGQDTTNVNGRYSIGPVPDGFSYWIDVAAPAGYDRTTPANEPWLANVPSGSDVTVNFGYKPNSVPSIDISKTPDNQAVRSGSVVTFTISVTNTGNVDLTGVAVSDPLAPACAQNQGTLAPGAKVTYTCQSGAVTADFTNVASVSGTPAIGSPVNDSDTADVNVIFPAIAIAKTPDTQTINSGGDATFTIAITNTGDIALTNVSVSDALTPDCNASLGSLASGASASYSCAQSNVTNDFTNSATVNGTPPAGSNVSANDTANVVILQEGIATFLYLPIILKPGIPATFEITHYSLNEPSGPPYVDSAGGHHGVCAGQCPAPTSGKVGGAQAFNATTGISAPPSAAFDWSAGHNFSIEAWVKTAASSTCSGNQVIVGRDDASTQLHWWVGCLTSGTPRFLLIDKLGNLNGVAGTTDITDGNWHHLVAVRDGSANRMRIYIDGALQGSTVAVFGSGFDSGGAALNIGWLNLSHGFHFQGSIDEMIIYNKALSDSEVLLRYNMTK